MPSDITQRPTASDYASYYHNYISLVPAGNLMEIAERQLGELRSLLQPLSAENSRYRYAEGKWSIREVVGHLTDTERVFSYRATAFSRADANALPGYDQNAWNPLGEYHERELGDVLDEWEASRRASLALMRGMPASALERHGTASNVNFTVLSLLAILPGHVTYHINLFRRDYSAAFG